MDCFYNVVVYFLLGDKKLQKMSLCPGDRRTNELQNHEIFQPIRDVKLQSSQASEI